MGRNKGTPVQRFDPTASLDGHDGYDQRFEVLGRMTTSASMDSASTTLANNIEATSCSMALNHNVNNANETRTNGLQFTLPPPHERNGRHTSAVTLHDRLDQILRDQEAKRESRRASLAAKRRQPSSPKIPRCSSSRESTGNENDDSFSSLAPPEVEILRMQHCEEVGFDNDVSSSNTQIHIHADAAISHGEKEETMWNQGQILLAQWTLCRCTMVVVSSKKQPSTVRLRTYDGAYQVLQHCVESDKGCDVDLSIDSKNKLVAVAQAIQQGTLFCRLDCSRNQASDSSSTVKISVGIEASNTLSAGDPSTVIIQPKGRKQQQQATAVLSRAIAALLPDSLIADVVNHPSRQMDPDAAVTAKQVYALIDNLQYDKVHDTHDAQPLSIVGLVPTLRPYQEAAVRWMLEREESTTQSANSCEWELAWIVVYADAAGRCQWEPLHTTRRWSKHGEQSDDVYPTQQNLTVLFHSPFTGWWVDSYENAKLATLGETRNRGYSMSRGGILAESMGLGKTVEVLACILAHPRQHFDSVDSSDVSKVPTMEIQYKKSFEAGTKTTDKEEAGTNIRKRSATNIRRNLTKTVNQEPLAIQKEGNNFDIDSDESSTEEELEFQDYTSSWAENPTSIPNTSHTESSLLQITDLEYAKQPLGVCICGEVISLDEKLPVVLCENCREPLHATCADLETTVTTLKRAGEKMARFRFGGRSMDCGICPEVHCPCCCCKKGTKVKSRATLIVTPPAILGQWQREIQRHTAILTTDGSNTSRPLNCVVYPGIKALCNKQGKARGLRENSALIHPRRLGDADVVLVTFDTLMGDLNHSDDNPFVESEGRRGRSLRQRKLYRVVPSPLLSINWWRICLDEAQRIETPTTASAKMALKLHAEHRWCVSGTPVGRGKLEDLHGLLLFQRLLPFDNKMWFAACFRLHHRGFENRLRHLLHSCLWRSTKTSERVRKQMGIPEQIEKKVVLEFNSIERHFYQRQHEETLNAAADLQSREKEGKKRSISLLNNLSTQMHKLRAACCHPQVGSSGLGRGLKRRFGTYSGLEEEDDDNARILSMDQILDRLIDDARLKAEEAQRHFLLHNNAMAALAKLKVLAKDRGITFQEGNAQLLAESCNRYLESLKTLDENSKPTQVTGEAVLSGSVGFQCQRKVIRDGRATLRWQMTSYDLEQSRPREIWARFDFEGPSKKLTQIKLRLAKQELPDKMNTTAEHRNNLTQLCPKTCIFQVSSKSVGGAFIDVVKFELPIPTQDNHSEWTVYGNFRTNRSKSWRLYIQDYHTGDLDRTSQSWCCAVDIELAEAYIGGDSLQRLHILHNAALSFETFMKFSKNENHEARIQTYSTDEMKQKVSEMRTEARRIEELYMAGIVPVHNESQRLLKMAIRDLDDAEQRLFESKKGTERSVAKDIWDDEWWSDMLLLTSKYGSPQEHFELCRRVHEDLNSAMEGAFDRRQLAQKPFPPFNDVIGLYHGVSIRIQDLRKTIAKGALSKCLAKFLTFPTNPNQDSIIDSSTCRRCKKDWTWTEQMCAHCTLSIELNELEPDRLLQIVLGSLHSWMKGARSTGQLATARSESRVDQRAKLFYEALEATKKAKSAAERAWRVHLDLLNDLDELNMCKGAMRLSIVGEVLSDLTEAESNGVVQPNEIASSFMDNEVKQASAAGQLRRHSSTLRYLMNQNEERMVGTNSCPTNGPRQENCMICLSDLEGQRAVLSCGHSFHYSPCLERLVAHLGSSQYISCPLRCTIRTKRDEVMLATERRAEDVMVVADRKVKGSWGTKVTCLVADVLDVSDRGEKSIVFSQWEDMIDVIAGAFRLNNISFVRVTSLSKITECTKRFRSQECSVFLLNVKNGAEGLSLVEATHVFMVEPLLNCGLDLQAINRIHRIGQTSRTFVHRYLMKGTIEMNIDKFRTDHQEDQLEDEVQRAKNPAFKAGGIDGGFSSHEELLSLLTVED